MAVTGNVIARPATANRAEVLPFRAMDVLARANTRKAEGRDVLFMCVGQPQAPAPKAAREAARNLIEHGSIGYTDAAGRMDLRTRIARHYVETHGVEVDAARIFVTTGSSAGFVLAFTLLEPGSRVALASPGYPAYRNILKALSLEAVEIPVDETSRWALDRAALADVHERQPVQAVLAASPANPTGTMTSPDALRDLTRYCEAEGIRFVSDEIYHRLTYPQASGIEEATALAFSDEAIVVNSFSKYYCMTGWRIGWIVLPERDLRTVERLGQNLYICAPEVSQVAALHALAASDELEVVRAGYERNRNLLLDRLPRVGFGTILPIDGAFYAYVDVSPFAEDSVTFCNDLLEATGVAITPGIDFDLERGKHYVRLSFAGGEDQVAAACDRMEEWLG